MSKLDLMQASQKDKNDVLFTPGHAVDPILPFIPNRPLVIWEPFDAEHSSQYTRKLELMGHTVVTTDILTGFDFLKHKPDFYFDMIVSNPPYSVKTAVLKTAYEYGRPFAFLMPLTALEGIRRNVLFRKYGLEVLVIDQRIDFSGGGANWFNASYFCWQVLPEKLMFHKLDAA